MRALTFFFALCIVACGEGMAVTDGGPHDAGPAPDGAPACTIDETTLIQPAFVAGFAGSTETGALIAPDALLIDPPLLIAADQDIAHGTINLYDLESDDPSMEADALAPIANLDSAAGFDWVGISGIARAGTSDLYYVVENDAARVRILRAMGRTTAPYFVLDGALGRPAAVPTAPADGEFVRPQNPAIDSLGRIWITDDGRRDVQVFDAAGAFLFKIGDPSYGPTEGEGGNVQEPEGIVIDEARDRVYVCDESPLDVVVYRFSDRTYLQRFGGGDFVGAPNGIDIDQYGYLYILDEGNGGLSARVRVFDPDTLQQVWVFGEMSPPTDTRPGFFFSPDTIDIDVDHDVLVLGDQGHNRVQGFYLSDLQRRACIRQMVMASAQRAVEGDTLTVRVDLFGPHGRPDRRVYRESVPLTATDATGASIVIAPSEVLLANGSGSATVRMDRAGSAHIAGRVATLTASRDVEVSASLSERVVQGALGDADLEWSRNDGVVRVRGTIDVPAGKTLRIGAGTLVLMETGARIDVHGSIEAVGTWDDPIAIVPSMPGGGWQQIEHYAAGPHRYENVFIVGGGAGLTWTFETYRHCCVPILRGHGSNIVLDHVVMADGPGKAMLVDDGEVRITWSAFHRLGMGPELHNGVGLIEDSHVAEMRGPDDDDGMYLSFGDMTVRRSVVAGVDDDGIDTDYSDALMEDLIIHDAADKGISLTGEHPTIRNVLITDCGMGIKIDDPRPLSRISPFSVPTVVSTTIARTSMFGFYATNRGDPPGDVRPHLERTIFWDTTQMLFNDAPLTNYSVSYCDLEDPSGLTGTGIISADPLFLDPARNDFRLRPYSPAAQIDGAGGPIGWPGY